MIFSDIGYADVKTISNLHDITKQETRSIILKLLKHNILKYYGSNDNVYELTELGFQYI